MRSPSIRFRFALVVALALLAAPLAAAGGNLYGFTAPRLEPAAARVGDVVTVSFDFDWTQNPCRALGFVTMPSGTCYAVMQWRITLDGPHGDPESAFLASGQRTYDDSVFRPAVSRVTVTERVVVPAAAVGDHTVHVALNLNAFSTTPAQYPLAGAFAWFPCPLLGGAVSGGCGLDFGSGWVERTAALDVLPGAGNPAVMLLTAS